MGYNSTQYIHTVYQAMNLAFADRDFYYGDPYFPPEEPMQGLLNKEYAKQRAALINPDKNDPMVGPGDPYPFESKTNPWLELMKKRGFDIAPPTRKTLCPRMMPVAPLLTSRMNIWTGFGAARPVLRPQIKKGVVSITPAGLAACLHCR